MGSTVNEVLHVKRLTDDRGESAENQSTLDGQLCERLEPVIRQAWPELACDIGGFVAYLSGFLSESENLATAIQSLSVEDLYLAYACSRQNPRALRIFAHAYEGDLDALARRFRISETDLNDCRQAIWDKLFVASDGSTRKILDYRGAGRLRHWFRAVAARVFLDKLRRAKPQDRPDNHHNIDALHVAASDTDIELAAIRKSYGGKFREAFEAALLSLEPDERTALRCHYLLSMTVDEMAAAFGTHRATAARRVARARAKLYDGTRARIKSELAANSGDVDSIMRMYGSELSVTLSRLLK